MMCDCDCDPGGKTICVFRDAPGRNVSVGCLLFGYGSEPPADAICTHALPRMLTGVAGIIVDSVDLALHSEYALDLPTVTAHINRAMKAANWKLWEFKKQIGQAVYVGGTMIYTAGTHYAALSWGGGAAYVMENNKLARLDQEPCGNLIYDALGRAEQWTGRFVQGFVPLYGDLFGTAGFVKDLPVCEREILTSVSCRRNTSSSCKAFRQNLTADEWGTAVMRIYK